MNTNQVILFVIAMTCTVILLCIALGKVLVDMYTILTELHIIQARPFLDGMHQCNVHYLCFVLADILCVINNIF